MMPSESDNCCHSASLPGAEHPLWDRQVSFEQEMRLLFETKLPQAGESPCADSLKNAIRRASACAKHGHAPRLYRPTIIQPKAWTDKERGGYWTLDTLYPRSRPLWLGFGLERGSRSDIVAAVINYLQAVPWRINQRVLAVVSEAKRTGLEIHGLPQEDLAGQEPPLDAPDRYEQWQRCEVLAAAYAYAEFDRFYFPYMLSLLEGFTTVPRQLQPHGSDLARGLLEFADSRAVVQHQTENGECGNEGHQWLARHLSSCFGSLCSAGNSPDTWAFEREGLLRQIAADPFEHCAWMKASKPWQALAAVFEWVALLEAGSGFASRLPISTERHPLWQRWSHPHPAAQLAAITAAQAGGIALTGFTSEHFATHAADARQAMVILEEADKVGVQAEKQDSLELSRRFARYDWPSRPITNVELRGSRRTKPSKR